MIAPYQQDESAGIGKARRFHQNLLRGVQPNKSSKVTSLLKVRAYAIVNPQRTQMQFDRVDDPFDACFEERSNFKPDGYS